MALFKHRDTMSIPDGLMKTKVPVTKGMAVVRRLNSSTGVYEIDLPQAGEMPYGFVDLRIDEKIYKFSEYDAIEAGKRAVVYTLVKDNEWRTDQFTGSLAVGDKVIAGTDGKLAKFVAGDGSSTQDNGVAFAEVIALQAAMAGYEKAMVVVKIL